MAAKSKKVLILAIIFLVLILTPLALNIYYNFLLRPLSKSKNSQIFIVKPGQPIVQIGRNLEKANLIKSDLAFRLYVAQSGIAKNIQAGDFRLAPDMSTKEIAQALTHGAIDIWVTFPEGIRVEEMAQIIENKLKTATNDKYQFNKEAFIQRSKEGFMFPDTYLIAKDATAQDIINRMQLTFEQKVDKKTLVLGQNNDLNADDLITLASLIEREAKTNEERPVIAGILINRLKEGIPLQVDATIQYAKGYDAAQNNWWSPVTVSDYQLVKSIFNTYLHVGLPPAPICNPGLDSIRAAASPAQTDYLYYLHDSQGKIHYAKTAQEHQDNISKYLFK